MSDRCLDPLGFAFVALTHHTIFDGALNVQCFRQGGERVLGLKQARSLEAETAIEAAEEFMRGEGSRSRAEIDAELRHVLAGHDDFWPRWVVATHPELAGPKA